VTGLGICGREEAEQGTHTMVKFLAFFDEKERRMEKSLTSK